MLKKQIYAPVHLLLDKTPYFITGAIYQKRHLLTDPEIKLALLDIIKKNFLRVGWKFNEYVILNNHYHILGISDKGEDLPTIIKGVHGASTYLIRKKTGCDLPVWWNYWDYCPRDEKDYYTKLNYLYMNPIKHGYISDLNDYIFSSFPSSLEHGGRETMIKQFHRYPDYQNIDTIYDDF